MKLPIQLTTEGSAKLFSMELINYTLENVIKNLTEAEKIVIHAPIKNLLDEGKTSYIKIAEHLFLLCERKDEKIASCIEALQKTNAELKESAEWMKLALSSIKKNDF